MIKSLLRFLKRQKPEPPSTPSVSQTDTQRLLAQYSRSICEIMSGEDLTVTSFQRVIGLWSGWDLSTSPPRRPQGTYYAPGWAVNDFRREP
jgi:hypothetical protein